MFLASRGVRKFSDSSFLIKTRQFGLLSVLAITANVISLPLSAQAQIAPDGTTATEVKGNAIAPTGAGTVNGGNLYHSFDKFNVPESGVIFNTGNSSVNGSNVNNIINRVTGDTPSNILGAIESRQAFPNANLYLLNPNGVVFSENARLDIGGSFHVTTGTGLGFDQNQRFSVDKNSVVFPNGDPKTIQFAVAQPAAIINQGNLAVKDGKSISLTAGTVINTGSLAAPSGNVDIAAVKGNSQVQLRSPDSVLGLAVTRDIIPTNWNGTITALPKLAESLTGKAAEANQVVVKADGTIALVESTSASDIAVKDGMAIASGKINVASNNVKGGNVGIFGDQVGLVNAKIDASGATGGGTVLVGGDLQGKGTAPNAQQTYVDPSSQILANGLLTGDGGKVIVWADRSTQFLGAIAARGGEISGNGGFVEVSGKENLDYRGDTDTRAPKGNTGTLLLDPTNISIAVTGGDTLASVSAFANAPANATISNLLINNATTNVVLQATNNISFGTSVNIVNNGISLTAQAGNTIFVSSDITTQGGDVRLTANDPASGAQTNSGTLTINAPITTNGGAINLQIIGAGSLSVSGNLDSGTGSITLTGNSTSANGINLSGTFTQITSSSGAIAINGTSSAVNGNGIFVSGGGDSVAITSTNGTINLSGNSTNVLGGDGIQFSPVSIGSSTTIQTNGNINITGDTANPAQVGLNIRPPDPSGILIINSGNGNLTFTSDRSEFPTVGLRGSGTLTLRPFSNSANLQIGGVNTFVSESFLTTLAAAASTTGSQFQNIFIGNSTGNNAIALVDNLNITTPIFGTLNFAPITLQTASTFDAAEFAINTSTASLVINANQGISNLGNIVAAGGNVDIVTNQGSITSNPNSSIRTDSNNQSGGGVRIIAPNGSLTLGAIDTHSNAALVTGNGGNITLSTAGNISVGNLIAFATTNNNGNAGLVSFTSDNGTITFTGNTINLSANKGTPAFSGVGSSINFANNVIFNTSAFSIDTTGITNSGNVTFTTGVVSNSNTLLFINAGNGDVTSFGVAGTLAQPLGDLSINSTGTKRFNLGAIAGSISLIGGNTIVGGDLVALDSVGGNVTLGNTQLNGNLSIVANEINFTGTQTGTGNITLKPISTNVPIEIGGTSDFVLGILELTSTDLNAFSGGTFSSLIIGHADGTGAVSVIAPVTFAQPTIVRSPLGVGTVAINANITATNSLTIEAGSSISLGNSTNITSTGGALNVVLNSDRDANNSGKISIGTGALINTNGGDIVLGGGANPLTTPAVFNSFANHGATINGSLNAAGGNITINGSNVFTGSSGSNVGVHISSGAQVTTNGTGNITINGSGGIGGSNNHGVEILTIGTVVETANGNINITGTGNGTTSANNGIFIANDAVIRTTGSGSLNLTGTSNSTGSTGSGIVINRGTLAALGTGNILLNGTSGTGSTGNVGISITGLGANLGLISTTSGAITLQGTSRATGGDNNQGILLGGNATVRANSTGNITLTGTGGNGVNSNQGILIELPTSNLIVTSGALNLTGTGNGSGITNHGIAVNSGVVDAIAAAGNITMTGSAPANSFGIIFNNANIKPTNTSGNLTLNADEMESTGLTTIRGTGSLFVHPLTATRNITLGGTANANNGSLELSDAFINNLQNGFAQVFIGRSDSSGLISLGNNVVFNNPVTLRSPLTNGAINTSGFNFRNITGNVTFLANQNITAGNIIASGNTTSLTSTTGAINTSSGTIDTSADGNGGNISFSSATGLTVGSLNTASKIIGNAGAITFSNGNITFAGSSIDVSSNSGNAQNLTFGFPVTLSSPNLTINTVSSSGTSGTVTFFNTVNGTTAGVNNLTINSGSGSIAFNNSVGSSATPLGSLFVNSTDATRFNSTVNAASLNTNASGTTQLSGNVTTTTSQIYNGAVNFTNAIQLTSTNSDIIFNSSLNGNQALTLNSGTGNITFGGNVGSSVSPLGDLTANSTGITRFNSIVNATNLTTNAGGTTELNGNITTSGTQTFNDAVTLTNAVQLDTTNSAIAFGSTVNGTQNLTLNSGTANITFAGTVGGTTALGNLVVNSGGTTQLNSINAANLTTNASGTTELNGNVTTSGTQTYNDAVTLTNAVTARTTNSNIVFNSSINGNQNLTLTAGTGNISLGIVGNSTQFIGDLILNSSGIKTISNKVFARTFTTSAGTTIVNDNINTVNGISLGDFVINSNVTLTANELDFLGNGSGNGNVVIAPFSSTIAIALGGTDTTNTLNLTATDLAAFAGGTFSSLTIGNSENSISLAGNASFAQPTLIQSPLNSGTINTSGFDLTNTGGSLTLLANQNITTGNITASSINLTSNTGTINTSNGTLNTSSFGNGGAIDLLSTVGNAPITVGNINTSSTLTGSAGALTFGTSGLVTFAGSQINLSSVTGNAGIINLPNPVVISSNNLTINTASSSGNSGAITFGNTLNGAIANSNNLTLNAGTANVSFNGAIGNSIPLGNLTINTTGATNFSSTVRANNLTTNAGGTTTINGDISTTGAQVYNDAVTLASNTQPSTILSTFNSNITFNGTVNGNQALTLNAGSGNITLGTMGNTARLGNLIANSSSLTTFNGVVNATTVETNAGGTTNVNANINTTATQTYGDTVNLSAATIFTATDATIAFNGNITGNQALRVVSGTADINFRGTVNADNLIAESGGITRFNGVNAASVFTDAVGTTELNGNITTTVSQIYNDPVSLTAAVQLQTTSAPITFNGNVTGGQNLTLNTNVGNIAFNGLVNVGNLTVNTLAESRFAQDINTTTFTTDVNGTTVILGNVTTSGIQNYQDAVLVGANSSFNSSNSTISFARLQNAAIGTPSNVTFNTGTGNLNLNAAGSLADRLGNITITNANDAIISGLFANSFTQIAGTGETRLSSAATHDLTGNFNVTSNQFSIAEAGTLNVGGNVNVQAANGITIAVSSTFSTSGAGTFDLNADTNIDGNGTFLNRGIMTDTARTRSVNITAAIPDIRNEINAARIALAPSVANRSIAIGSVASGDFKIEDFAFEFLKADTVAIAANGGAVSIGSASGAFPVGMSLEIGTATSPASSIIAVPNFTLNLNVDRNLSLAASNIQLGNTTVGGDLTFTNPTTVGQSTGRLTVNGLTKFLINNPDTDIILRRGNLLNGGASFAGSQSLKMRDLELNNAADNSSITDLPTNFRNLILTLENSIINLSNTSLTGKLELTGRDIVIDQDISATSASLRGDNITIARNFTTTDSSFLGVSLGVNSSGTFQISPTSNINVAGEFFDSGTGNNAIAGNITAKSIFFNRPVNLVGDTNIVSTNSMRFFGSINGEFALKLDANGNQISMSQLGNITPLSSFTVAPNTTLAPYSVFSESSFDKDNVSINVTGDISLGNVINDRDSEVLISGQGAVTIGNITTAATIGNAGNVTVNALQNLTTGNINASAIAATGGNVQLTSSNGRISTGDVNTSGSTGGEVFYDASTAINAGVINSSGRIGNGGNVTLDPVGDVVVRSIDASSPTQGGSVTLVSTGGNLRIMDTILSSNNSACVGASICTLGGTGGQIALQTGGLGSFFVGDPTLNGSAGFFTTGLIRLEVGTIIPVLLGSTFTQGGISITPGGFLRVPPVDPPIDPKDDDTLILNPEDERILAIRDVLKKEADRYFREGNLAKAFDAIERAYVAELETFTGQSLGKEAINIENTQDLLSTVAQQTGDVAALIYPVLLDDRIEILVVPPKDRGKPFSQSTVAANQQTIQEVISDYRNNLRDVGSNDFLEQSQQLYDWIIRPIEKQLSDLKVDTLVFAMDSGLRVTPPAALHDGKQFLIQRYAIANIPAIRATRTEERNRKATRVLAMGLTESVQGFSALPSVDIEIRTISSELLQGDAFLNTEFTVNNLQNQRQQGVYNILHLGTHAQFVSDTSKESFIQFWDSRLRLSQIPKLRFDNPVIDMLTLSACQTAVGNNLGISGLAVESGARSVLASLWEVSDAGTAPLMISFYKSFPDAANKAQAMRQAQMSLLSGKVLIDQDKILGIEGFPDIPLPKGLGVIDLSHPFYWSSFILVGNWL